MERLLKGGNKAKVSFLNHKKEANLHAVWDHLLIENRIALNYNGDRQKYYEYLLYSISNKWKDSIISWLSCGKIRKDSQKMDFITNSDCRKGSCIVPIIEKLLSDKKMFPSPDSLICPDGNFLLISLGRRNKYF